jgi:DNA primase
MTISELKEYIYNEQKIEYVLKEIGCHSIVYHPNKDFYSCGNYNGDNQGAINVKNNGYLGVINWTRTKEFGDNSDIITLVQYNKGLSFIEAIKYLHKILDLPFEFKRKEDKPQKKFDPLSIFKRVLRCNRSVVNVDDIKVLEDKLLDDYVPMLHIDWFREGIMPWTRERFKLAYSYKHKRVIVPLRYWATGELLGFNQRTTVENYDEFGIKKYFITPTYPKALNLYGLYENYDSIQKAGYVVVAESEKSVLKRDSLGDRTIVALSGKSISDEQVRILMGLNVEIIIGLDKDVDVNEIRHMCEKFKNVRKVSYIYDFMGILNDKDAPMDARDKDYKFLLESRIVYDRNEQRKYQESLKDK